jgi:hypothetical protein
MSETLNIASDVLCLLFHYYCFIISRAAISFFFFYVHFSRARGKQYFIHSHPYSCPQLAITTRLVGSPAPLLP